MSNAFPDKNQLYWNRHYVVLAERENRKEEKQALMTDLNVYHRSSMKATSRLD
jgi:hypothetical protein